MLFCGVLSHPCSAASDDAASTRPLNKWQQLYIDRTAKFRAENEALKPGDRPILFVGDSLSQGMPVAELFPGQLVLNRGITSDGIANFPDAKPPHYRGLVNRYEDSILNAHPRVVFIQMGSNDVGMRTIPLDYWQGHLESLIDRVQKDLPEARIVLHTLPPSGPPYARVENLNPRAKEYNERLRALAARRNLPIIDLWNLYVSPEGILPSDITSDGLHLKREAYERWAAAARPFFTDGETTGTATQH